MKNTIITAILVILSAMVCKGQTGRWSLKPMAGMTVATLAGDAAADMKNGLGLSIGVESEASLCDRLGLSIGAVYETATVKYDLREVYGNLVKDDHKYRFRQIGVPLMLHLTLAKGLSVATGLKPTVLLSAKSISHIGGYYVVPTEDTFVYVVSAETMENGEKRYVDEEAKTSITDLCNQVGLEVPVGLSYTYKNIVLDVRYHFGINNTFKEADAQLRHLSVTLGYQFGL